MDGDLTESVLKALRRITRAMDLHSHYLAAQYGLTGPQLLVLRELSRCESAAVCELAEALHLSQATVTGILKRLATRDLITRGRNATDRRRMTVRITPEGGRMLSRLPPLLQRTFAASFSRLEDWEQTQILSTLQRVAALMTPPEAPRPARRTGRASTESDAALGPGALSAECVPSARPADGSASPAEADPVGESLDG